MNGGFIEVTRLVGISKNGMKITPIIYIYIFYYVGHYFPEKVLMNIWNILYKITENDLCEENLKKEKSKKHLRCNILDLY